MSDRRAGERWGVQRAADGTFEVHLPAHQRAWLRDLPEQLRELVSDGDVKDDPALRRLFPVAYPDDQEMAVEYDAMVRDDLAEERLAAAELMARTLDAEHLSEDEALAWLSTLNSLRLVLGTRLDITEGFDLDLIDDDDPEASAYLLYAFLTELEASIVEALSEPP